MDINLSNNALLFGLIYKVVIISVVFKTLKTDLSVKSERWRCLTGISLGLWGQLGANRPKYGFIWYVILFDKKTNGNWLLFQPTADKECQTKTRYWLRCEIYIYKASINWTVQKCWCVGYYWIDKNNTRTFPVPRSRNIIYVSGLYPLHQSLVIGSYVIMMVYEVLSDRYRRTQEEFQYQGVEICLTFRASTLYQMLEFDWQYQQGRATGNIARERGFGVTNPRAAYHEQSVSSFVYGSRAGLIWSSRFTPNSKQHGISFLCLVILRVSKNNNNV